jgi:uncharacterized protein YdaU (DUF1376 family)
MSKVRRIDWSPDEWIAGTFGLLTQPEYAVYMVVLMVIYSRGGECPNDAAYVDRHFKSDLPMNATRQQRAAATMRVRRAIDRLIELGKLRPADSGGLTNGRANHELTKAQDRIKSAVKAGTASGQQRANRDPTHRQNPTGVGLVGGRQRANRDPTHTQLQANSYPTVSPARKNKDLAPTRVRNHQPSTIISSLSENITDAAREPAPSQSAPARAPAKPELKLDPRLEVAALAARQKLLKGES